MGWPRNFSHFLVNSHLLRLRVSSDVVILFIKAASLSLCFFLSCANMMTSSRRHRAPSMPERSKTHRYLELLGCIGISKCNLLKQYCLNEVIKVIIVATSWLEGLAEFAVCI